MTQHKIESILTEDWGAQTANEAEYFWKRACKMASNESCLLVFINLRSPFPQPQGWSTWPNKQDRVIAHHLQDKASVLGSLCCITSPGGSHAVSSPKERLHGKKLKPLTSVMWVTLEANPLAYSSLQMTAASADILNVTSWQTLSQDHPAKLSWIPDPQNSCEIINAYIILSC